MDAARDAGPERPGKTTAASPKKTTARCRFRLTTARRAATHESRSKRDPSFAARTSPLHELPRAVRFENASRPQSRASRAHASTKFCVLHESHESEGPHQRGTPVGRPKAHRLAARAHRTA